VTKSSGPFRDFVREDEFCTRSFLTPSCFVSVFFVPRVSLSGSGYCPRWGVLVPRPGGRVKFVSAQRFAFTCAVSPLRTCLSCSAVALSKSRDRPFLFFFGGLLSHAVSYPCFEMYFPPLHSSNFLRSRLLPGSAPCDPFLDLFFRSLGEFLSPSLFLPSPPPSCHGR